MFGTFQLEQFKACELNQEAASAWSAVENLVGCGYKPLLYVGKQVAKGTDYVFVAEQTIMSNPVVRRVISFTINCIGGEYDLVEDSIEVIAQ